MEAGLTSCFFFGIYSNGSQMSSPPRILQGVDGRGRNASPDNKRFPPRILQGVDGRCRNASPDNKQTSLAHADMNDVSLPLLICQAITSSRDHSQRVTLCITTRGLRFSMGMVFSTYLFPRAAAGSYFGTPTERLSSDLFDFGEQKWQRSQRRFSTR